MSKAEMNGRNACENCNSAGKSRTRGWMDRRRLLLGAAALPIVGSLGWKAARAETKNVKISLDWVIQGTHAPFFIAQKNGYFAKNGVRVDSIDAGKGATNVAVSVAGGAYQFGWVDLPSMIRFNASNPAAPLIAVYISFDATPLAIIARKSAGIEKAADLNGKKIAGGPGTAVHDTISIFLKAAKLPDVKIDWVAIQPQLFGPMLKQGSVDGTGGFVNSNLPAALEVGFRRDELSVLKYADYGADLYGLALVTSSKFALDNPDAVKAVVAGLNAGTKDTIAAPDAALALMKARDPIMKMDIEKIRLDLALELTDTPHVRKYGLSSVDPKKLQFTIDAIAEAYKLTPPSPDTVYTSKFLPPDSERILKG